MNQHISSEELSTIAATRRFTTKAAAVEYLSRDRLECLICGKEFEGLHNHVSRTHGVSAREYKIAFNLPRKRGLEGAKLVAHRKEVAMQPHLLEMARICGAINGALPRSHKPLSPLPVYEDWPHNARIKPPVITPPNLPPGEYVLTPVAPGKNEFAAKSIPTSSQQPLDWSKLFKDNAEKSPMKGYDKKTLVARVERLEKAMTILLNAATLAFTVYEDK
jgi:hypothetical protein